MNKEEFLAKIELAVRVFYKCDNILIELGVSERVIEHRIALYLEPLFKEWNVDCEYNRYGVKTKELENIRECREGQRTDRIYPDIVIHERGSESRNNIAVIEIKAGREMDKCDEMKLALMTGEGNEDVAHKYEFGLWFGFYKTECRWILFKDGEQREGGAIKISER